MYCGNYVILFEHFFHFQCFKKLQIFSVTFVAFSFHIGLKEIMKSCLEKTCFIFPLICVTLAAFTVPVCMITILFGDHLSHENETRTLRAGRAPPPGAEHQSGHSERPCVWRILNYANDSLDWLSVDDNCKKLIIKDSSVSPKNST